jgi:hypothetical protein
MKRLSMMAALLVLFSLVKAQNTVTPVNQPPKPEILSLKQTEHDFGKIPQGRPAIFDFEIVNIGKDSLKLENVQASCGCTTPEWNHDLIAPGATAKIKVGYNAHAEGPFTKTVTIFYNNNQTKVITIKGEVYKSQSSPAPENASVQLLKQ